MTLKPLRHIKYGEVNSIKTTLSIQNLMETSGVKFGTSGVRGLVSAMTSELCFAYTLAFVQTLNLPLGSRIVIGMDLRPSSSDIVRACASAIKHAGYQAEFCGALPTPALAYYAQVNAVPAIMVTGSHIPFDRNGIKFYGLCGEITKADEVNISRAQVGMPAELPLIALPSVSSAAATLYLNRYLEFFPQNCLSGLRLGFYEHSSVARDILRTLLEALGAEVISLGRTDEFVPIDTEAVSDIDIQKARDWASEYKFDAIFSTDGDADRPLIGDEYGNWLRGDIVGILCAQYLNASAVVTPVSSNTALELSCAFQKITRTRIGSPYVIAGMEALIADGVERNPPVPSQVVGFEANGGFLLGSTIRRDTSALSPLMTRDAVLPILTILAMSIESNNLVSQLASKLPARFTGSGRLQSFPSETSKNIIQQLAHSNVVVEDLLGELCGVVADLDLTDGLRIIFQNDEIVHFRASGNAPELRCYAEANFQQRADFLSQHCLQLLKAYAFDA
ncbi:Phosphomannomutase [Methylotenera mobilis JLW8]|uniref:Phosphomannomutase n=1 Tax=Methylotenera mobilis (strain JLW8 / ATCC BAA-1282 / DSM 17540) TaxID=583345 RepID=C6WXN9_METML|nr:Phosphomannomutase [Methylotenera mobilis JLW8]